MGRDRICVVVAVALGFASAAPAAASEHAARALDESRAAVLDYWTPERMRAALPASELLADVPLPSGLPARERGRPSTVAARAPAERFVDPTRPPYRTHGKVFFTLPSGDYVCSGTVVTAETKRLVVTAGHCVFGDGTFASNWMFVPGKDGGEERYGRWTAARLATTDSWRASEDVRYDVGMATMRKRNGRRIQRVVGARGIAFSQGRDLFFRAFGYPAEAPFDGSHLYRCKSPAQGTDGGPAPQPTRIDCDMTGGASGGGWIIRGGRVNSVVSYGYECVIPLPILCQNPEEGKLFGPYFGRTIKALYRAESER